MQLFHRNSRSWDITAKHTLERIQTNATNLQSHNPTHAHLQWRETTQVHRMQKVIQPSSKSEHSYVHSHWRESPNLCTVQKVIHTNWKIEEAHIHRQWRKATQLNYRVQKVIQHSWNLGQTFAYAHWREAPPLYQVSKIIGRNGILKNHIPTVHCTMCIHAQQPYFFYLCLQHTYDKDQHFWIGCWGPRVSDIFYLISE